MICILHSALLTRITIRNCDVNVLCYLSFYYDIGPFVASHLSVLSQGRLQLQVRCDSTKPGEDLAVAGDAPLPGWRGLHLGNFSRSQRKKHRNTMKDGKLHVDWWIHVQVANLGAWSARNLNFFAKLAAHERNMFQALCLWWNGFVQWVPLKAKIQCLVKPIGQCHGFNFYRDWSVTKSLWSCKGLNLCCSSCSKTMNWCFHSVAFGIHQFMRIGNSLNLWRLKLDRSSLTIKLCEVSWHLQQFSWNLLSKQK